MGQPNRQLSPPILDLRHFQDHFGFTFPRVALTGFSRDFSRPVFEPSAGAGNLSSSAGSLLPRFQHGTKTWVRRFSLTPEQKTCPTPRCRDCTIAFINCKSFLLERNCRRTASSDTTQRQLTIRSNNKIPIRNERYIVTFKTPYHTCFECRIHQSSDSPWESIPRRTAYEEKWGAPVFSVAGFLHPRSARPSNRRGHRNRDGGCMCLL